MDSLRLIAVAISFILVVVRLIVALCPILFVLIQESEGAQRAAMRKGLFTDKAQVLMDEDCFQFLALAESILADTDHQVFLTVVDDKVRDDDGLQLGVTAIFCRHHGRQFAFAVQLKPDIIYLHLRLSGQYAYRKE